MKRLGRPPNAAERLIASFFAAGQTMADTQWRAPRRKPFHPRINRWTGKPHEHAREIARRQHQSLRSSGKRG